MGLHLGSNPGFAVLGYVFVLSRQEEGPCNACWMTDSVIPVAAQHEQKRPMPAI
jgi:hypothetical protein